MKLFQVALGATINGRHTEQHDVFFGIAHNIEELIPDIKLFWKDGIKSLHIDGYRIIDTVENYRVIISEKSSTLEKNVDEKNNEKIFFVNLGGYKSNILQEFHEQYLFVCKNLDEAKLKAKDTEFYKHMKINGNKMAGSHIDNKYGVDVDDVYDVEEILPFYMKEKYQLELEKINHIDIGLIEIIK